MEKTSNTKWKVAALIVLLLLAEVAVRYVSCRVLTSCAGNGAFSDIRVGDTFAYNIDGYCQKLPHNYCLMVLPGSETSVYVLPDELPDESFLPATDCPTPILSAPYIKGYYNDTHLVLCEETEPHQYRYLSVRFIN